ncbi:oxygen-dependent protoporphyrinogen oxidase [Okibacterium sp. HSC-33S16]|uniref:protoporphyrinogen oxidase n=1 Tax=Okibacterium sp. HSC-33S16 TaxID=2910965 RepID=UPI00209DC27D|nr:protoporphyrinogen oxidase [Okibacterium sp. HSC-33S16]MCP2032882.1 oxygen-dependent protoporphyrinogen oxidase [Okibacterium sp. HSC-33S16]
MIEPRHVLVIGGGVAGLVAALDCARVGIRVTVVEKAERAGGSVATETVAGIRVDTGAESFATRQGTVRKLVDGLGLSDSVVRPAAGGAWVRLPSGVSAPLPKAGLLGIPSNPLADDVRRVIGWRGALRAYLDRIRPVLTIGLEHNLGELVSKRMGAAVLNSLVAPVTRGVYSADPYDLDVTRAAPGLNKALTTAGSLSGAVAMLRSAAPAGSNVEGLRGGMYTLVEAMLDELRRREATIVLGSGVAQLRRLTDEERSESADGATASWRAVLDDDQIVDADYVIVATPEEAALTLLAPLSDDLSNEEPLETPTVELATLVLDAPELDAKPRGTGVLVAEATPGQRASGPRVTAKALTHSTAKWQWLADEATSGHPHRHVVRLSYGRLGSANPSLDLGDDALRALAVSDAAEILGVPLEDSQVLGFTRTRWVGTLPGAAIGQRERAERLRTSVLAIGELDVTGGWLSGTGLASVVPDALAASARIRSAVAASYLADGVVIDPHTRTGMNDTSPDANPS